MSSASNVVDNQDALLWAVRCFQTHPRPAIGNDLESDSEADMCLLIMGLPNVFVAHEVQHTGLTVNIHALQKPPLRKIHRDRHTKHGTNSLVVRPCAIWVGPSCLWGGVQGVQVGFRKSISELLNLPESPLLVRPRKAYNTALSLWDIARYIS